MHEKENRRKQGFGLISARLVLPCHFSRFRFNNGNTADHDTWGDVVGKSGLDALAKAFTRLSPFCFFTATARSSSVSTIRI